MEYKEILKSYFKENSIIQSQIDSYDYFVNNGVKEIVDAFSRDSIPDYLLDVYDEVNLKIENVRLGEPEYIEVDGSKTMLTPKIAKLRGLTYASPLYLTISTLIGSQKEEFEVQIARLPIMLKSDRCVLKNKTQDELIQFNEDPFEPGGYFVVNGTEKVVVLIEDLALNRFFVDNVDAIEPVGRMFSERGVYKSLQEIKKLKDGSYIYTFGNFKNIPLFLILKALGMTTDRDIVENMQITDSDVLYQMAEYSAVSTVEEAQEMLAKKFSLVGSQKEKMDRISFYLNNFIVPHVGVTEEDRISKAKLICRMFRKYFKVLNGDASPDDKDNYGNKRVKLVGHLFKDLFQTNFNELIIDILTNFQRMIKRGRFSSMKIIIREQLLTQKINSALAIGTWSDGRKGVAQYLKRENYFDMLSHLTRVVSPLSTSQENFQARELHPTHYGRLCPVETPEGHSIGLRKNLALMATVSYKNVKFKDIKNKLEEIGLNN